MPVFVMYDDSTAVSDTLFVDHEDGSKRLRFVVEPDGSLLELVQVCTTCGGPLRREIEPD